MELRTDGARQEGVAEKGCKVGLVGGGEVLKHVLCPTKEQTIEKEVFIVIKQVSLTFSKLSHQHLMQQ